MKLWSARRIAPRRVYPWPRSSAPVQARTGARTLRDHARRVAVHFLTGPTSVVRVSIAFVGGAWSARGVCHSRRC